MMDTRPLGDRDATRLWALGMLSQIQVVQEIREPRLDLMLACLKTSTCPSLVVPGRSSFNSFDAAKSKPGCTHLTPLTSRSFHESTFSKMIPLVPTLALAMLSFVSVRLNS
jgi:hypothetical protein